MQIKEIWNSLSWNKKEIENYDGIAASSLLKVFGNSDRGISEAQKYFAEESPDNKIALFYAGKPVIIVCSIDGSVCSTSEPEASNLVVDVIAPGQAELLIDRGWEIEEVAEVAENA